MSNHIHLIWQNQSGHEREAIQRDFLKFTSQTIIRDLKKNHPKVLERFYVETKDRKYQLWERNPLSIDIWMKEVFMQRWNTFITTQLQQAYATCLNNINIHRQSFMKQERMNLIE